MVNGTDAPSQSRPYDPGACYSVIVMDSTMTPRVFSIQKNEVTVGRKGGGRDIELASTIVSREHGVFRLVGGQLQYVDLHTNRNGTYWNGTQIHSANADRACALNDGDILRIDSVGAAQSHSEGVLMIVSAYDQSREEWRAMPVQNLQGDLIISREPGSNHLVIPRINVSRRHARIYVGSGGGLYVEDLHSLNHTLLNGQTLTAAAPLRDRDVISVCSTKIILASSTLLYNVPKGAQDPVTYEHSAGNRMFVPQNGNSIRLCRLKRTVKDSGSSGMKTILDLSQVELTIRPGEMVAIIGGSGAGKTTLMNCMNAFEPANYGDVLINGNSLYKNRKAFRLQIGYVPQQDIVHDALTVREMLTYAARLRLPRGLSAKEIDSVINATMQTVGLEKHANTMIRQLSGGQKKRSSIAAEMVADPTIFFLDEPTSGLDPEMELSLITQLRDYAHKGAKTVVIVTHTLQSIRMFDRIIFLAPSVNGSGGRLAFYGSYDETVRYFGVEDIIDAYRKVNRDPQRYAEQYIRYTAGR